jgi:hypothetical protein
MEESKYRDHEVKVREYGLTDEPENVWKVFPVLDKIGRRSRTTDVR